MHKDAMTVITPSLTFPTIWKNARTMPIHKTGDTQNPSNYMPISILPSISKILEKSCPHSPKFFS